MKKIKSDRKPPSRIAKRRDFYSGDKNWVRALKGKLKHVLCFSSCKYFRDPSSACYSMRYIVMHQQMSQVSYRVSSRDFFSRTQSLLKLASLKVPSPSMFVILLDIILRVQQKSLRWLGNLTTLIFINDEKFLRLLYSPKRNDLGYHNKRLLHNRVVRKNWHLNQSGGSRIVVSRAKSSHFPFKATLRSVKSLSGNARIRLIQMPRKVMTAERVKALKL